MSEIIIGLAGKARVGKSTAATLLADGFGLFEIQFAEPIKRMLRAGFRWDLAHTDGVAKEKEDALGFAPRQALQEFGRAGRELRADLWLELARREYRRAKRRQGAVWQGAVFSDVRTEAEAAMVRRMGGLVLHILRPGVPTVREDVTEFGVQFFSGDRALNNLGTISQLRAELERVLVEMREAA